MRSTIPFILALVFPVTQAVAQLVTFQRLDAKPPGHPEDTGHPYDPIMPLPGNKCGVSMIRVPDWIPDSERTHPDAEYYMYYSQHHGDTVRMAWSDSLTGVWHKFNDDGQPDRSWGAAGNYTGAQTPRDGVLNIPSGESHLLANLAAADIHMEGKQHYVDVIVDDVNERIIMYFHVPTDLYGNAREMVATSKWGLNFNMPAHGGEAGHGVRDVFISDWYAKLFAVEGRANGQTVRRTFSFDADFSAGSLRYLNIWAGMDDGNNADTTRVLGYGSDAGPQDGVVVDDNWTLILSLDAAALATVTSGTYTVDLAGVDLGAYDLAAMKFAGNGDGGNVTGSMDNFGFTRVGSVGGPIEILSLTRNGAMLDITFMADPGTAYELIESADLQAAFTPAVPAVETTTDGIGHGTLSLPLVGARKFVRVRQK